jgi:hypothetical protein
MPSYTIDVDLEVRLFRPVHIRLGHLQDERGKLSAPYRPIPRVTWVSIVTTGRRGAEIFIYADPQFMRHAVRLCRHLCGTSVSSMILSTTVSRSTS